MCYWVTITAIYLTISFLTGGWQYSWLVFAISGILFPVVLSICNYIAGKKNKD